MVNLKCFNFCDGEKNWTAPQAEAPKTQSFWLLWLTDPLCAASPRGCCMDLMPAKRMKAKSLTNKPCGWSPGAGEMRPNFCSNLWCGFTGKSSNLPVPQYPHNNIYRRYEPKFIHVFKELAWRPEDHRYAKHELCMAQGQKAFKKAATQCKTQGKKFEQETRFVFFRCKWVPASSRAPKTHIVAQQSVSTKGTKKKMW